MSSTKSAVHIPPAARFVSDFTHLIAAIDHLMMDIGWPGEQRTPTKPNGEPGGQALRDVISTLREHAQSFVKSLTDPQANGANGASRNQTASALDSLLIDLSRALTLDAIAETIARHCKKAFSSPAGMIVIECNGKMQMLLDWHSTPQTNLAAEIILRGPVARTLSTGTPLFFDHERANRSNVLLSLGRLLKQYACQTVAFLPIGVPQQRPVGVLTMALPLAKDSFLSLYDRELPVGRIASGWILRARDYEEAIAARAKVESDMQSKDEFLSMLSHELRGPMVPILGWAVALSSGPLPANKQNLALEGIVRNVRALNYLIEDLFDAVRISSGKLRLEFAPIRIQDVAREALTAIQPTIENKKLRVSTDISEAIPPFSADSRRLLQVLMNLLNNAVKFTPEGGSIALRVRRRGDAVECTVSDTGKGIDRKFLPFVFDRLRQGPNAWKDHAAGLGLGLAIVREIIELHGGAIQAISDGPDKGSAFVFRLLLKRKNHRPSGKPPANSPQALRKKILNVTE